MIESVISVDPDEEGEKVLSSDLADDGQDTRRCILCWHYGDADPNVSYIMVLPAGSSYQQCKN